jgi:hypothetical protein
MLLTEYVPFGLSESAAPLDGESFARWYYFDYTVAIPILNHLLEVEPLSVYGNLFRGSSRLLHHSATAKGKIDLETALLLAPDSADVHYVVADAYTYGVADFNRAFVEITLADQLGLETPRTHAIFAAVYLAFGDVLTSASHLKSHIDMVTTELLPAAPLVAGFGAGQNLRDSAAGNRWKDSLCCDKQSRLLGHDTRSARAGRVSGRWRGRLQGVFRWIGMGRARERNVSDPGDVFRKREHGQHVHSAGEVGGQHNLTHRRD